MRLLDDNQMACILRDCFVVLDHDRYVRGPAAPVPERHAYVRAEPWLRTLVEHFSRARFSDRSPRDMPG